MATLPSSPWTDIDSTRVDQDSPGSEDLFQDIVVDLNYLKLVTTTIPANKTVFTTPGLSTYVVPAGVTKLKLTMQAGGGAGSNGQAVTRGGGGGGGGECVETTYTVTPGATYSVYVGAGGVANNAPGLASYFDVPANSALPGQGGSAGSIGGAGGAGGSSSSTSTKLSTPGQNGQSGSLAGGNYVGGLGGDSANGYGGRIISGISTTGEAAQGFGAGGAGGSGNGGNNGGNGSAGYVTVEY